MDIVRVARCLSIPWACSCALLLGGMAHAQGVPYRVTGPDGRVTYTDRPPADARSVHPLGAAPTPDPDDDWLDGLPFNLRQTGQRYPVKLYTAPGCAPCDLGRLALQQRGVPFREWRVEADGGAELQRLEGTTSLPVLRVGRQQLLGFEAGEWRRTLDAAGYPAASALPRQWQAPAVQALRPPARQEAPAGAPKVSASPVPSPAPPAPAASGFRF